MVSIVAIFSVKALRLRATLWFVRLQACHKYTFSLVQNFTSNIRPNTLEACFFCYQCFLICFNTFFFRSQCIFSYLDVWLQAFAINFVCACVLKTKHCRTWTSCNLSFSSSLGGLYARSTCCSRSASCACCASSPIPTITAYKIFAPLWQKFTPNAWIQSSSNQWSSQSIRQSVSQIKL